MIHLFAFTLSVFGVTFCVGHAKISVALRAKLDRPGVKSWVLALLECPACLGWHLGWIAAATGVAPHVFGSGVIGAVFCAFYCCATSLVLAKHAGLD